MNSTNKKSPVPQLRPLVAQVKTAVSAQSFKRPAPSISASQWKPQIVQQKRTPVAPPVYRPQGVPRVLQTKTANHQPARSRSQVEARPPAAPRAYRPLPVPKVLQTKKDHQRVGAVKPLVPGRATVVQRAARPKRAAAAKADAAIKDKKGSKPMEAFVSVAAKKMKWMEDDIDAKGQGQCGAVIYYEDEDEDEGYNTCEGAYSAVTGFHAEMAALNTYLGMGKELSDIRHISITSPPCLVCKAILNALELQHTVLVPQGKADATGHKSAFKVPDSVLNAVCAKRGVPKAEVVSYLNSLKE